MTRTQRYLPALFLALSLPASAGDALESPNVKRLGKTVVQYKDDVIQVVVGYRYASGNLKEPWLLLDTYLMPAGERPLSFQREDFGLLTPDGTRVNLPSQRRFAEGLADVDRVRTLAAIAGDPLEGYFSRRDRVERIRFFVTPSEGTAREDLDTSPREMAYGYLFFSSPKGSWEKGIYTLVVKNKDVDVKLPIPLGIEGELERVK